MKTLVGLIMILAFCIGCQRCEIRTQTASAQIPDGANSVLTAENFVRIRQFIILRGQRQTYCNMFNNNPFFPFAGFNMYLNPVDQGNINCELAKSDFPTLVIQTSSRPGPNRYWNVHLDDERKLLQITQHDSSDDATKDPDVLAEEVAAFFQGALVVLKETAGP